mmetsp:Transcript_39090/g.54523  ORF Transcript_39090/g.54523 Transcript_39090/m.54523 type:complete len:265 (-) Transcript_39090:243-1037(-)
MNVMFQRNYLGSLIPRELDISPFLFAREREFSSFQRYTKATRSVCCNNFIRKGPKLFNLSVRLVADITMAFVWRNVNGEVVRLLHSIHTVTTRKKHMIIKVVSSQVMKTSALDHFFFLRFLVKLVHHFGIKIQHHEFKTLIMLQGIIFRIRKIDTPVIILFSRGMTRTKHCGFSRNVFTKILSLHLKIRMRLWLKMRLDIILSTEREGLNRSFGVNFFSQFDKFREAMQQLGRSARFNHDFLVKNKKTRFREKISLYRGATGFA